MWSPGNMLYMQCALNTIYAFFSFGLAPMFVWWSYPLLYQFSFWLLEFKGEFCVVLNFQGYYDSWPYFLCISNFEKSIWFGVVLNFDGWLVLWLYLSRILKWWLWFLTLFWNVNFDFFRILIDSFIDFNFDLTEFEFWNRGYKFWRYFSNLKVSCFFFFFFEFESGIEYWRCLIWNWFNLDCADNTLLTSMSWVPIPVVTENFLLCMYVGVDSYLSKTIEKLLW